MPLYLASKLNDITILNKTETLAELTLRIEAFGQWLDTCKQLYIAYIAYQFRLALPEVSVPNVVLSTFCTYYFLRKALCIITDQIYEIQAFYFVLVSNILKTLSSCSIYFISVTFILES